MVYRNNLYKEAATIFVKVFLDLIMVLLLKRLTPIDHHVYLDDIK